MQADLYIRVSTEEQKKFGFSQRYQEQVLKTYCNVQLLEVGEVVFEDCSAKTFDRPGWKRLFYLYKEARLARPRILLFTKWDRFSRNTADAYYMIYQLSLLQVEVRAIEQPLDLSIPETKIMMAFYLASPEAENARRGLNIRQGLARGAREGRYMSRAPVGYINKMDSLGFKFIEPVAPYASLLQLAFEELAKDVYAVTTVFHYIASRGFDKSLNCLWGALRNPIYCGKICVPGPDHQLQWIKGQHTPVISEELFNIVQQVLDKKRVHPRKDHCDYRLPLRGILVCNRCSKVLTGSGSKGQRQTYFYYHCISRCGVRFGTAVVHVSFLGFIKGLTPLPYFLHVYYKMFDHLVNDRLSADLNRQLKLQLQIEELNKRLNRARELLLCDSIDIDEFRILKETCLQKTAVLQEAVLSKTHSINERMEVVQVRKEFISHLDLLFENLEIKGKRELATLLFPFGLVYAADCFSMERLPATLQIIYDKDAPRRHLSTVTVMVLPDEVGIEQLHESVFMKGLIRNVLQEITGITLRQVIEIITYFKRVVSLCQYAPIEISR